MHVRISAHPRGRDFVTSITAPFPGRSIIYPTSAGCASFLVKGITLISSSTIKPRDGLFLLSPCCHRKKETTQDVRSGLQIGFAVARQPGSKEKPRYRPILLINNFYFCSQYVPLKIPECLEFLILLGPEVMALYRHSTLAQHSLLRSEVGRPQGEGANTHTLFQDGKHSEQRISKTQTWSVEGFKYTYSIYINLLYRISTYWFPCDL